MSLSIVTNTSAMMVRSNLNSATDAMTQAIERMTTGFKVNRAKDDAAGYNIIDTMTTKIGSFEVAADNAQIGIDMLTTTEENYALLTTHLQRIRDLTEQAANGTYSEDSLAAINAEITARLNEITRVAETAEYNGMYLMNGDITDPINIQIGLYGADSSKIILDATLFEEASAETLLAGAGADVEEIAKVLSGVDVADPDNPVKETTSPSEFLSIIDAAITDIASRVTNLGAAQNRLESAITAVNTNVTQLTNSRSTMRDADIAEESTSFISAQILQSAASTLLATANQIPSIAVNLI